MSQIQFKRGIQSNLDSLMSYEDGCFYLTTDTNKFYVAKSENDLVEITSGITMVSSYYGLPQHLSDSFQNNWEIELDGKEVEVGKIVYSQNEKALYVCSATSIELDSIEWTRLNQEDNSNNDTVVTGIEFEKLDNLNPDEVIYELVIHQVEHDLLHGLDFPLEDIRAQLILPMSSESMGNNSEVINYIATGDNPDSLIIGVSNNNTLETREILSENIIYNTITIDNYNRHINNQGNIGNFYSADKVDELIAAVDLRNFKGTLGEGEKDTVSQLPTENVHWGDTYVASGEGATEDGIEYKAGDMFIANGETDEDKLIIGELSWIYIPSTGADTKVDLTWGEF